MIKLHHSGIPFWRPLVNSKPNRDIVRYKPAKTDAVPTAFESPARLGLEPKGLFMSTYGCQMNDNDSERMVSLLEFMNYSQVSDPEQASLIIINSCSVREKPVHKVHSEVGRYKKLKIKNPDLKIGVAGCVAQQEKDKLLKDLPLLDFVLGPDNIDSLPQIVSDLTKNESDIGRIHAARFKHQEPYHVETLVRNPGVSTFVNITKGCDNFCTFCVVPYTRGRERSRPYSHLVDDVNRLVSKGVKEVTLLGQNVNSYKCETGVNFAHLMKGLCEETDIERIRYTTSHPKDFSDELIEISRDYSDKICEYIHLPVQSGSSEVLERMNRGYTREHYLKIAEKIYKEIPNVSFSTDLIVGFPGETNAQFEETLSLLEEVKYETLFAFKYSPRPFTKAARFEDQVDEDEKSERLARLFEAQDKIAFELCKKYQDQVVPVLVEGRDEKTGAFKGRNPQNKTIYFQPLEGQLDIIGKTLPVKITKAFPTTLRGELISNKPKLDEVTL
jgi:tRNA-2-methylthio-N6-dimethylallyladenosine synthase